MPRYLFAAMALAILSMPVYAQNDAARVGTLMEVEGEVSLIVPGAAPSALKNESPVHMNDVIETGPGARALILLIDDTEFTLGESAQFRIDEYIFDEENSETNKGRYSVLRGAFLYTSGLVAKKDNPDVTVNTPYGAIGIRGTSFWGGEIDGEYGVLVTDGQVSVQTDRGRIFVGKGQGTALRARAAIPARAGVWSQDRIDRAVKTISLKNAAAARERVTKRADLQKQDRARFKEVMKTRLEQRQQQQNGPVKRIDNAPRPIERRMENRTQQMPEKKTELPGQRINQGAIGSNAPSTAPAAATDPDLFKPFSEETMPRNRKPNAPAESLLKATPTNTVPETELPAPAAPAEKTEATPKPAAPSGAPQVELPALGDNEAHTNEMKEQQHLQKAPAGKGSAGAL